MFHLYPYYSAIIGALSFTETSTLAKYFIAFLLFGTFGTANNSSSVFAPGNRNGASSQFALALNVDDNSKDLYFRLSGPSHNSWIAVGTGSVMAGSMMFVVYTSSDGKSECSRGSVKNEDLNSQRSLDITLSPRLATGHNEPSYSTNIQVSLLDGSGIANGTYTANVRCQNCTSWPTGSLNLKSTAQSWIYAIGPSNSFKSDSQTATIQRHEQYGKLVYNTHVFSGFFAHTSNNSRRLHIEHGTSYRRGRRSHRHVHKFWRSRSW